VRRLRVPLSLQSRRPPPAHSCSAWTTGCCLSAAPAIPAKGKLAVPGGFIDIGETAEDGLRREIREEVNLAPGELRYLCTQVNDYVYRDINYPVLDLYFVGRVNPSRASPRWTAWQACAGSIFARWRRRK
jgi:ADP-ribose pyrophosphatase YjhB (NUDIX family)